VGKQADQVGGVTAGADRIPGQDPGFGGLDQCHGFHQPEGKPPGPGEGLGGQRPGSGAVAGPGDERRQRGGGMSGGQV
jgi:hypothetical protein